MRVRRCWRNTLSTRWTKPFRGRESQMNLNMVRSGVDRFPSAWPVALATVLLVSGTGARSAEACSCFTNPPCAAVWKADAVFVGTIVDTVQEPVGGALHWTVHKVAVNQPLHGAIDSFITLAPADRPTTEQIEASKSNGAGSCAVYQCDYHFELGRR